jgi:hypothetical protein
MPTQTRIWTAEDAQQLKTLREARGLDIVILAKRHALSVHQVRQLEEDGDDRFYSQAIKLQVGRKLLTALGGNLVELPQVEDEAELASDVQTSPVPEPLHASAAVRDATQSTNLQRSRGRVWGPLAGLTLVALAWFGWQQSVTDAADQKKNPKLIAAVTEPQPSAIPAAVVVESSEQEIRLDEPPTALDGVGPLAATPPSPQCRFGSEPKRVSVFEPRRPGTYVYFEAQEPVSICVRDAAQQITTLELTAGRGRTVRGSAPFEVLSQQFSAVRIFYQGKMVAPGVLTEPHIVLRPLAIVEPATEVN